MRSIGYDVGTYIIICIRRLIIVYSKTWSTASRSSHFNSAKRIKKLQYSRRYVNISLRITPRFENAKLLKTYKSVADETS